MREDLPRYGMWDLVEEHFDDACFLFAQRRRLIAESDLTLALLESRHEERLLGNVDGLLHAGDRARAELLLPGLAASDGAVVSACAFALLEANDKSASDAVWQAFANAEDDRLAALVQALELSLPDTTPTSLQLLVKSESLPVRTAAMHLLDWHALAPSPPIDKADEGSPPELVCAVLQRHRRNPSWLRKDFVLACLDHDHPCVQDDALLAAFAMKLPTNEHVARQRLESPGSDPSTPLLCLALSDGPTQRELLEHALAVAPEAAVVAMGYGGQAWMAEALLPLLEDEELGGLATDGFLAITGAPIHQLGTTPEQTEEKDALPPRALDATAQQLVQASAPPLPTVDPVVARQWWTAHKAEFAPSTRYLAGRPYDRHAARAYLIHGPLRRRHIVALELALREGEDAWVRTRALGRAQRATLARLA